MGINKSQIKELIENWDWVVNGSVKNPNDPWYKVLIDDDVNDVEIKVRDKIHDLGLDENPEVVKLDKKALKYVLEVGAGYRIKPPQAKDKTRWWWHLDELAKKTYPADLLPDYLRDIYLNS